MNWELHKEDWPMAAHSKFVVHKPHRWHVQEVGRGPLILLIHGAGGASQSWRHLHPLLSEKFQVISIDLPGQGFTKLGAQQRCGLREMAHDIHSLVTTQGWKPMAIVGHSAGAAIALEIAGMSATKNLKIIGINSALDTFKGVAGLLFPVMAKTLAMFPMVADAFIASTGRGNSIQKLLDGTGSKLSSEETKFYRHLINDRQHVNGTLQMMAQWDLTPLIKRLSSIQNETMLIASDGDLMVPSSVSQTAAATLPNASFHLLNNLGHLAHEEDPKTVANIIFEFLSP